MKHYEIKIKGVGTFFNFGKSVGNVARKTLRDLIRKADLRNQPLSDSDGGWKGVEITCLGD